jgi:hypothetical protein
MALKDRKEYYSDLEMKKKIVWKLLIALHRKFVRFGKNVD